MLVAVAPSGLVRSSAELGNRYTRTQIIDLRPCPRSMRYSFKMRVPGGLTTLFGAIQQAFGHDSFSTKPI